MSYTVGDVAHLTVTLTNRTGTLVDPTAITLTVEDPTGFETVETAIVRDSLGKYSFDLDIDRSGKWTYRWASTGTGQAAEEASFYVKESAFA